MKTLGTIRETDIFPDRIPAPDEDLGGVRQAVRIVLFDADRKIAMGYYPPRENISLGGYNLPGGGVDDGESIQEALLRESLEEIGCHIKNVTELGMIYEHRVGKKVKHNQETYCFAAEVDGPKLSPQFTEEELEDKLELQWLDIEDAAKLTAAQSPSFAKVRTLMCLEEARNTHIAGL